MFVDCWVFGVLLRLFLPQRAQRATEEKKRKTKREKDKEKKIERKIGLVDFGWFLLDYSGVC